MDQEQHLGLELQLDQGVEQQQDQRAERGQDQADRELDQREEWQQDRRAEQDLVVKQELDGQQGTGRDHKEYRNQQHYKVPPHALVNNV